MCSLFSFRLSRNPFIPFLLPLTLYNTQVKYYQWDDWHKEIEVYDNKLKPLEVIDPVKGEVIPKSVQNHKELKY